jgi:hypothetical protein
LCARTLTVQLTVQLDEVTDGGASAGDAPQVPGVADTVYAT